MNELIDKIENKLKDKNWYSLKTQGKSIISVFWTEVITWKWHNYR